MSERLTTEEIKDRIEHVIGDCCGRSDLDDSTISWLRKRLQKEFVPLAAARAHAASGLTELTAEQRAMIERERDSPFQQSHQPRLCAAIAAALSALDSLAAENATLKEQLAAKERECGDLYQLRDRVIEIFQPMQDKGQNGHTFELLLKRAKAIAPAAEGESK
jgi:hypothetical protein